MKKMAAGENTSTSGATHAAPEFRAKVTHMKNWKPASPPSVSRKQVWNSRGRASLPFPNSHGHHYCSSPSYTYLEPR